MTDVQFVNNDTAQFVNNDTAEFVEALTDLIVPDPRWEEPNLLLPSVKPTGPCVIDRDNQIGSTMASAYLFSRNRVDVARGTYVDKSTNGTEVIGPTQRGLALLCGGPASDQYTTYDEHIVDALSHPATNEPGISLTFLVKINSLSTRGVIFQDAGGTTSNWIIYAEDLATDELRFSAKTWNANYASSTDWSFGEWLWITGTFSGSTAGSVNIYVNGKKGTGATETVPNTLTVGPTYLGEGFSGSFNRELDGEIAAFFVHNRELTEPEVISLHRDPYQVLLPA